TGTPISQEDRDTRAVFGDYVSIYDIQDAVDDGATVETFYESRLAKLDVNRAQIEELNAQVVSDGVTDIFALAGLNKPNIGLLSEEFLEDVRNMPQKNLVVELLEKPVARRDQGAPADECCAAKAVHGAS